MNSWGIILILAGQKYYRVGYGEAFACLFKIFVKPTGTYRNINPWDKSLMSMSVHYTIQITVI
jgi:hypothetical protein